MAKNRDNQEQAKADAKVAEQQKAQAAAAARWEKAEQARRDYEAAAKHATKYDKDKQWGDQ